MNKIYFVRHGENLANTKMIFSHKVVDYSLNEKGKKQAKLTRDYFKNIKVDTISSSPLKRAKETAEIINEAKNLDIKVMENFREINVGDFDGENMEGETLKDYRAVIQAWLDGDKERTFPNGENYNILLNRMKDGIKELLKGVENKNIVIVGHAGIISVALLAFCDNLDFETLKIKKKNNCSITELEVENNEDFTCKLISWAYNEHLTGEAGDFYEEKLKI